jgi:hypothetical protein
MFRRRHGIVRATVRSDQVVVLPAPAETFFAPLEGARVMAPLAATDALSVRPDESLLAALYYFRLARAAVGCWFDATGPLLAFNDKLAVDESAVLAEAEGRAARAASALALVLTWHAEVETIRAQRAAVDQVAALPLVSRDLRELILASAARAGVEPPSVNRVRRRVGAWYRGQLRDRLGPIMPPVPDLGSTLAQVGRVAAELAPAVRAEARRVVAEMVAEAAGGEAVSVGSRVTDDAPLARARPS